MSARLLQAQRAILSIARTPYIHAHVLSLMDRGTGCLEVDTGTQLQQVLTVDIHLTPYMTPAQAYHIATQARTQDICMHKVTDHTRNTFLQ